MSSKVEVMLNTTENTTMSKAMNGEECKICSKPFRLGETVLLVNGFAHCPRGTGCTRRVLDKRGVTNLTFGGTGVLVEPT